MNVKVHLVNDNKNHKFNLPRSAVARDTLKKLEIPPDTVIIMRYNQPIPIDTPLEAEDELEIIRVVSGG